MSDRLLKSLEIRMAEKLPYVEGVFLSEQHWKVGPYRALLDTGQDFDVLTRWNPAWQNADWRYEKFHGHGEGVVVARVFEAYIEGLPGGSEPVDVWAVDREDDLLVIGVSVLHKFGLDVLFSERPPLLSRPR